MADISPLCDATAEIFYIGISPRDCFGRSAIATATHHATTVDDDWFIFIDERRDSRFIEGGLEIEMMRAGDMALGIQAGVAYIDEDHAVIEQLFRFRNRNRCSAFDSLG